MFNYNSDEDIKIEPNSTIHAARALIVNNIKCSPTSLNQCPEGTQNITIPSFKKVNIINLLDVIKNLFTPHNNIVDVEFEISSFLEIDDEFMAMTYKGCSAACNYCKKSGYWRSEYPEITHKNSAKARKQNNIAKTAVKLSTSTELNIKDLFDDSEKMLAAAVHNSIIEQDKIAKTTYFNVSNVKDAKFFLNAAIVYDDRLVDLHQTVKLEEKTQIITIPSFKKVNIFNLLDVIKILFTPQNTIVEVIFEIPSFLELDNKLMAMTYKGSNAASKTAVKLPTSTELNIKKLFDDSKTKLADAVHNNSAEIKKIVEK
ncbi:hypothetical protein BB561_004612 [Smittium simulii]|uniref:Uncharacterized protein n=1 Tax=Smittium simulii TaxID=133385 RepID=A0A2T9YF65_9FUNG|nr:hypothetical protein BB561_004612 [Smittium simulii]